jgi:hypothetical protein
LVRGIAATDDRVRLICQAENRGAAAARNVALVHAAGEIIAPLDADDLWRPDYLQRQLAVLMSAPPETGFVYALHRTIGPDGRVLRDFTDYGCSGRAFLQHLLVNFVGNGSAAVFRREAMIEAGGYDERRAADWTAEDYLIQLEVAARRPIAANPLYLVGYRKHPGSSSASPRKVYRSTLQAFDVSAAGRATPRFLRRWVEAEAALVFCAQSLQDRQIATALSMLGRAAALDPAHAAEEIARRVTHRLPGGFDPAAIPARGGSFWEGPAMRPSPLHPPARLQRRLARLAALDALAQNAA